VLDMPSITKTEAMIGPHTPGYAAPEQFNNLKKQIDSRYNIFSVGVVTYECITGENPFRQGAQSALDVLQRIETVTPASFQIPGDTQKQFMALLSSMMGKFPSRRPKNANQALDWLHAAKVTFVLNEGGKLMELYLQMGHAMQQLCLDLFNEWKHGTIVLSPMNIAPNRITAFSARVKKAGGNVLFDPQLYYPRKYQKIFCGIRTGPKKE